MLTAGKRTGLKAVSNERGIIAAAAMDQRGSLQKEIARARGAAAHEHDLQEFKSLVTSVLTRHASAILLDPEFGLPASEQRNGKGLLLAYEKTGYDAQSTGRLPDLLDLWSVRRLKSAGADCVKVLLYYSPFEEKTINERKHAWVERIGAECAAHDIAFFLELVGYDVTGGDEKTLEYALKKPTVVTGSIAEFNKDVYKIDVLKVEVPVSMYHVEGTKSFRGDKAYTRTQALQHFRNAAATTQKPFIYLSAGVSNPVFVETLELAVESGTSFNGVLCGRATWMDGIAIYAKEGAHAFEDWLNTAGVENIENVNKVLTKAHPWTDKVQT